MGSSDLFRGTGVQVGPIFLAEPVLTTWGIMVVLIAGSWIVTRRLSLDPGPVQVVLEGLLDLRMRRFEPCCLCKRRGFSHLSPLCGYSS